MNEIKIIIPNSLDALGRIVTIVRRAKVKVINLEMKLDTVSYQIKMKVDGDSDEVMWLVSKIDKLPEVLKIEYI